MTVVSHLVVQSTPRGVGHLASWSAPLRYRGLCTRMSWVTLDFADPRAVALTVEATYRTPTLTVPADRWWWVDRFLDLDDRPSVCRVCVARLRHDIATMTTLADRLDPPRSNP